MNLSTVLSYLQQAVAELQNYLPDLSTVTQQAQQYLAELSNYIGGLLG